MNGWTMAMKLSCSLPLQVPITDTRPPMRCSCSGARATGDGEPAAAGDAAGAAAGLVAAGAAVAGACVGCPPPPPQAAVNNVRAARPDRARERTDLCLIRGPLCRRMVGTSIQPFGLGRSASIRTQGAADGTRSLGPLPRNDDAARGHGPLPPARSADEAWPAPFGNAP